MRTNQPVNDHKDLLGVVDGLLEEMGLDRRDTGGNPLSPRWHVGTSAARCAGVV
jgi:hypothetical protein